MLFDNIVLKNINEKYIWITQMHTSQDDHVFLLWKGGEHLRMF